MRPAGFDQILAFFYRPQGRIGRAEFTFLLLLFVPIVGVVWLMALMLMPGTGAQRLRTGATIPAGLRFASPPGAG